MTLLKNLKALAINMLVSPIKLLGGLSSQLKKSLTIVTVVAITVLAGHTVSAQITPPSSLLTVGSLKNIPIPEPSNLNQFLVADKKTGVVNKTPAIALGKALFWDMQVGSDGIQSCASCHFHAGADNRIKNQLNPGLLRVNTDGTSNADRRLDLGGWNYTLQPGDYPFHKLADPNNRNSTVLSDTNDITSSQGVANAEFVDIVPGSSQDQVNYKPDEVFNIGGTNIRRVQSRNTPTVINAIFNFRNFWDGRAPNDFNGINEFGAKDVNAKLYKADNPSKLTEVKISLNNASLASQALGPPLSSFESSADGRTFTEIGDKFGDIDKKSKDNAKGKKLPRKLGKKLLPLRPLGKQIVHPEDSVLGTESRVPELGLKTDSYEKLIEQAFQSQWWKSNRMIQIGENGVRTVVKKPDRNLLTNEYTLMEYNFPLFFGLAVQLYEATLVSDDTPFDRFQAGDYSALTAEQQKGLEIFLGQDEKNGGGRCINCHSGPEFTDASVSKVSKNPLRRREGNIIDRGFNNIGVRPTWDDLGVGDVDPFGNPLSTARLAFQGRFSDPTLNPPINSKDILGVDGAFKTPGLRNIELTAPYFHNGGQSTLRQVVDFYARGGDFQPIPSRDGEIRPLSTLILGKTPEEVEQAKEALVAFLKSLTDDRVRYQKAPFDHPQLWVTNGHQGDSTGVINDGSGKAADDMIEVVAVGRNGSDKALTNFLSSASN